LRKVENVGAENQIDPSLNFANRKNLGFEVLTAEVMGKHAESFFYGPLLIIE
jgi:hypothetical protein